MTTAPVSAKVESVALENAIAAYQAFTKRTPAETMEAKGRDLRIALSRRFQALQPASGKIAGDARSRGWRVGRRVFGGGISPYARSAAAKVMGGQKSVYGRVVTGDGAPASGLLRTIRVGRRGNRITGGRRGTGGRAATAAEALGFRVAGERRLTRRNVEVHMEVVLRERGRGFLGSSFLRLRKLRGTASDRMSGRPYRIVANKRRTAFPFDISEDLTVLPNVSRFQIETNQEGIAERDAVVAAAYNDVRADTLAYLNRKLAESAKKAGLA